MRLPTVRQVRIGLAPVLFLVLAAVGALLVCDLPGLGAEYFALGAPWEGRPVHETVGEPGLRTTAEILEVLTTEVVFSVRWTGWWSVAEGGRHAFTVDADDGAYIRIDDELVVDSRGVFGQRRPTGHKTLEPGFHAVEIGLYQTHGKSRLSVHWAAPGAPSGAKTSLPPADLYAGRPLALRKAVRRALAPWPRTYRRLLGAVLLLAAALMLPALAARLGDSRTRLRSWLRGFDRRSLRVALLLGLFFVAFLASLPFTGTVRGGDDTLYVKAALFSEKQWFFNRYAHVYLLKLFMKIGGDDPLLGVRIWWSFVFAVTVASLAVAVRSVGPGLQLRTLTVTLFVLLAQTTLFGTIGAAFADYSAMMFVTAAVAVFLHGLARARDHPPPRHEWHALALGALTVAAFRSKEVGAVLFLLPGLFLIAQGRLDLRRFARRLGYWTAGASGVLLTLVLLDGWILGDYLFALDRSQFEQARAINFRLEPRKEAESWLHAVWYAWRHPAGLSLRNLWVGVVAAAVAAGLARRRLELRLLHLLPIAYLLALIVLYVSMPHPISGRMLIPILPTACLMTGLLLHYAGLDELPAGWLWAPRVLVPTGLAAAVIFLIAVPYRMGVLAGADFLPVDSLSRNGWQPDRFVVGVLFPALALVALSCLALVVSRRRARIVALLVAYMAFFGLGFEFDRSTLAKRWAVQKGDLLLYPWRVFREELEAARPRTITLSTDLKTRFGMSATTRTALAKVALRRQDLSVGLSLDLPTDVDAAIASRFVYDQWRRQEPALAASAVFDPAGLLVLVRPREVARPAAPTADR